MKKLQRAIQTQPRCRQEGEVSQCSETKTASLPPPFEQVTRMKRDKQGQGKTSKGTSARQLHAIQAGPGICRGSLQTLP